MKILDTFSNYNNWANEGLFQALDRYGDQVSASTLRLLSHIVNTQSIWLNRVKGEAPVLGVWEIHDLVTCKNGIKLPPRD